MRRQNVLVFDEQVTSSPQYTSAATYTVLGQFDQLAIHAIVDNPNNSSGATISIGVEHSAEGRNFLPKLPAPAAPEIVNQPIKPTATSQAWGYDDGSLPSLDLVRLKIAVSPSALPCHVRVYVTTRDQGR